MRGGPAGAALPAGARALPALTAVGFLAAVVLAGRFLVPRVLRGAQRLRGRQVLLVAALGLCLALAALASGVGLAPIVGAYAAGASDPSAPPSTGSPSGSAWCPGARWG